MNHAMPRNTPFSILSLYFVPLLLLLGACTSLNLVEQIEPQDKRVPVVVKQQHAEEGILYEWNGRYYMPLTVAMAKEDIPLLTSRMRNARMFYHSAATYTPVRGTERELLVWLLDHEVESLLELSAGSICQQPPSIGSTALLSSMPAGALANKKVKQHKVKAERLRSFRPVLSGWRAFGWCDDAAAVYPTVCRPIQEGTRSFGNKLVYVPLWVVDAAGNILVNSVECALYIPAGIFRFLFIRS